jgi:hypothetical protein
VGDQEVMLPRDEYGKGVESPEGAFSRYGNFPVLYVNGNRVQSLKRALYMWKKKKKNITVSAKKLFIAVPEVIILSYKCNFDGYIPDNLKIVRICD